METLQSIYDQYSLKITSNEMNMNNIFSSKIARRLLVLVFVEQCHEKINQIERLNKLLPLVFRSNQVKDLIEKMKFYLKVFRFKSIQIDWRKFKRKFYHIYKIYYRFIKYYFGFHHVESKHHQIKLMIGKNYRRT
jgi:hypothetical protein